MSKRLLAALVITSTFLIGCSPEQGAEAENKIRPVKTYTVQSENTAREKSYPAIVLPARQAELSFRSSGQILELPAKAASLVKEDDIIAKLDTGDFQSQVTALESQMEQARAQLDALTSGARAETLLR